MLEYPVPKSRRKITEITLAAKLTDSDKELLQYISEGLSNREIARIKNIQIKSCENAISRLAKKLEIPFSPDTNQRVLLAKAFQQLEGE